MTPLPGVKSEKFYQSAVLGFSRTKRCRIRQKDAHHLQCLVAPYLRVESLMVKGQPSGSTSYAPGFPATVELDVAGAATAPLALLPEALQPYLQWMKSSPICSATAMLFTTTVSLAASTGHLSVKGYGKIGLLLKK